MLTWLDLTWQTTRPGLHVTPSVFVQVFEYLCLLSVSSLLLLSFFSFVFFLFVFFPVHLFSFLFLLDLPNTKSVRRLIKQHASINYNIFLSLTHTLRIQIYYNIPTYRNIYIYIYIYLYFKKSYTYIHTIQKHNINESASSSLRNDSGGSGISILRSTSFDIANGFYLWQLSFQNVWAVFCAIYLELSLSQSTYHQS